MMWTINTDIVLWLSRAMFAIVGLVCAALGVHALNSPEQKAKIPTAIFWFIVGLIFIFGEFINGLDFVTFNVTDRDPVNIGPVITGVLVIVLAALSAAKQVKVGSFKTASDEERQASADRLKGNLFVPAVILAIISFAVAQWTNLGAVNAIGFGGLSALIFMLFAAKTTAAQGLKEGTRILGQVGPMAILPQVLAALGALFTAAGVGRAIESIAGNIVPEGNILVGVIAYCVGMALFTMIMGNAFAAYAVMTAGIGIPFVFMQGGDPLIASALAMTAGFCGTLMTPMAANFNIVPAALLEMKDNNGVIKAQVPVALVMLLAHIILMRVLAF